MSSTWKAAIGIILIFILGWFGGALTTLVVAHQRALALLQHDPEPLAKILERATTHNLGLNDKQRKQLHDLFVENVRQRMELQRGIQPQVRAVNLQTLQQVDAILSPEQQQNFRNNLVKFKERFGRNPLNVASDEKAAGTPIGAPAETAPTNTPGAAN